MQENHDMEEMRRMMMEMQQNLAQTHRAVQVHVSYSIVYLPLLAREV